MTYTASVQDYKGFTLEVVMETSERNPSRCHRSCHVIGVEGSRIAICKTKKEAKDLIDHDCFKGY